MLRKASCPGPAGKNRGTRFPPTLIFLLLFQLVFSGGKAAAVTWQPQGPTPLFDGEVVILAPPDKPADKNPVRRSSHWSSTPPMPTLFTSAR
jgi:hypothetical protein